MQNIKQPRFLAILLILTVSALSVAGVIGERIAMPLILLTLSLLFFTLAHETVVAQRISAAKRLLTLGLFLLVLAIALGLYAFIQ